MGHRERVHDVEHRDGEDRRDVEPDRDVEVLLVALRERPEEVDREHHPHERDREIDRPLELRVLLALREAERERDRSGDDDRLPAEEMDSREPIVGESGLQEPLRGVVDTREHHVPHEREDHRVGVQRAQSPKG